MFWVQASWVVAAMAGVVTIEHSLDIVVAGGQIQVSTIQGTAWGLVPFGRNDSQPMRPLWERFGFDDTICGSSACRSRDRSYLNIAIRFSIDSLLCHPASVLGDDPSTIPRPALCISVAIAQPVHTSLCYLSCDCSQFDEGCRFRLRRLWLGSGLRLLRGIGIDVLERLSLCRTMVSGCQFYGQWMPILLA